MATKVKCSVLTERARTAKGLGVVTACNSSAVRARFSRRRLYIEFPISAKETVDAEYTSVFARQTLAQITIFKSTINSYDQADDHEHLTGV